MSAKTSGYIVAPTGGDYISYVAFIVSLNIKVCAEMGIRP